jgi:hypothetical protein
MNVLIAEDDDPINDLIGVIHSDSRPTATVVHRIVMSGSSRSGATATVAVGYRRRMRPVSSLMASLRRASNVSS